MSYNRDRLFSLGGGNWRYKTDDIATVVATTGYFNEDGSPLKLGDVIERVTVTNIDLPNEAIATYGWHIVNSVVRGNPDVIDISDATIAITADAG